MKWRYKSKLFVEPQTYNGFSSITVEIIYQLICIPISYFSDVFLVDTQYTAP